MFIIFEMPERRTILQRPLRRGHLDLEVAIHPYSNGTIVLNFPGFDGHIDGYNNKYGQLADFLVEKGIGTVVRMGNKHYSELPYPQTMIDNFRYVLGYCISNGDELSGRRNPVLYLMGASAGAGTIAAVVGDYEDVERILLMAPSTNAGPKRIATSLGKFNGEVYIMIGQDDDVVKPEAGQYFYDRATRVKVRKLEVIPNCDHNFRGEINGRIMSKAPLWAFAADTTFPSPAGGIKLYD